MAFTTEEVINVSHWWAKKAYKGLGLTAHLTKTQIKTAVEDGDAWMDTAPSGGSSNQSAFVTSLPTAFKDNTTAEQKAILLAAIALGRAGLI